MITDIWYGNYATQLHHKQVLQIYKLAKVQSSYIHGLYQNFCQMKINFRL